jgi:hypothetical protein
LADLRAKHPRDWKFELVYAMMGEPAGIRAQAADRRSQHANSAFERAVDLKPDEVLPRAIFAAWAFSSGYLGSYRPEELPPEQRAGAPGPRLPDPAASSEVETQLRRLARLDPDNGVWEVTLAELHLEMLRDEEALAELHEGVLEPRFDPPVTEEVEVAGWVLTKTGIPRLEAEQEALRKSRLRRLVDFERLTVTACALAEDRWHAGFSQEAERILLDAVRLSSRGRSNSPTVEGSLSACNAALVAQAASSLRIPVQVEGRDAVPKAPPHVLARALHSEIEAEDALVARVRAARADPRADWNKWNASWTRAGSLSSGMVLFLEQGLIWGFLWLAATVVYLFIRRLELASLPASWRAVGSLLLITMIPPVLFAARILWHDFSLPWSKAYEHSILVPEAAQFTIVNAFYLTLIPILVCSVLAAGWRCRRHKVESTGFWPEIVSLLKLAMPIAVLVSLIAYAVSLAYLLGIRAESQAMIDSFLRHGEHIFLR